MNNCYVCDEEIKDYEATLMIFEHKEDIVKFHSDCFDLEPDLVGQYQGDTFEKCYFCKKRLVMLAARFSLDKEGSVFAQFWKDGHGWWKICKPCFDIHIFDLPGEKTK